jgi:hypothetical protein
MRARFEIRRRGQAITEFALVVPVMIVIILYSLYFTELVRANLKMQEASRFLAWEMTSYALDDYGAQSPNNTQAFTTARDLAITDALKRYKDLDSIDDRSPGGLVVGYSNVTAKIENLDAPLFSKSLPGGLSNSFVNGVLGLLNGGMSAVFNQFKFNTKGKMQVEFTMQLDNRLLPHHFLDEQGKGFFKADVWGGRNLQSVTLKNRFSLLADGWQLPDGADANQHQTGSGAPRSGVHRGGSDSGLYQQVKRMRLGGAPQALNSIPGWNQINNIIGNLVPDPFTAAYVVSHNYFEDKNTNIKDYGCDQDPKHLAPWGMNNLDTNQGNDGPGLDYKRRRCYDSAPFRDTANYGKSNYALIWASRGAWFMGCKNPQADNPSEAKAPAYIGKDKHNKKASCEGP